MPSYFVHFSPLGTKGVYTIGIVLHLTETQRALVHVRRTRDVNCERCGVQTPASSTRPDTALQTNYGYAHGSRPQPGYDYYYIDHINANDEIEVEVFDNRSDAFQAVVYKATVDGFDATVKECVIGGTNLGPIYFNPITVIDASNEAEKATIPPEESAIIWPPPPIAPEPIKWGWLARFMNR